MDTGLVSCRRKSESFISLSKLNQNDSEDNDNKLIFFQCIKRSGEAQKIQSNRRCELLSKQNKQTAGRGLGKKKTFGNMGQYTHRYNSHICAHL